MGRLVVHWLTIAGVLLSPLACCCATSAAKYTLPAQPEKPEKKSCCQHEAPIEAPSPGLPERSQCPCKQKEPRAVASSAEANTIPLDLGGKLLAIDSPPQLESKSHPHSESLTAKLDTRAWFATSQDILRALQVLRL